MTNEMKNVPKLRFPEFTGEWEKTTIGDIGSFYYGKSAPKWSITDDATIPCVRYGELYTKYKGIINEIYSYTNIDRNNLRFSKGGEILVPRVGEDPMDFAKCSYLPFSDIAIGEMISVYNTNQKPIFITSYFNSKLKYEFAKRVEGASVSNLYYSYLNDINLLIPKIEEQQKIGDFFSKLDQQIELEEQKLEKLEEQKKGYMQQIFSQELRFKDDNGDEYPEWKYNYLGNYLISHDEKTTENNQYPVLTSSREGLFLQKDNFTRDVASKDNTGYNVVPYGFFTYRNMSDDLVFKFNINYLVPKGIVSTLYPVFSTNDNLDNYFLRELLNNGIEFQKYALMQKQGGSRTYMYFNKLKNLKLHIPVLEEQQKTGSFLEKLDKLIEKQSAKVELLKERKKGFLQKMFV